MSQARKVLDPLTLGLGVGLLVAFFLLHWQFKPRLLKINQGSALVRRRRSGLPGAGTTVSFTSNYVVKLFDKFEIVDVTTKSLRCEIRGQTADHKDFTIKADFLLRLPQNEDSVLLAMEEIESETFGAPESLRDHFEAKFCQETRSVAASRTAKDLCSRRDCFRDAVLDKLGVFQDGFHLDAAFIDLKLE